MATYFRDFADADGISDFTEIGTVNTHTDPAWSIVSSNQVEATSANSHSEAFVWNDLDGDADRDDVEILGQCYVNSTSTSHRYYVLRMSTSGASRTGYALRFRTATIDLYRFSGSTFTQIATTTISVTSGTWCWVRFRINGTAVKARFWEDGGSEGGTWNCDTTDATYSTAGHVGLLKGANTVTQLWRKLGVGTNGDTAPSSAGSSITGASASTLDLSTAAAGTLLVSGASAQTLALSGSAAGTVAVASASAGTLATAGTSAGVIGSSPVTGASAALLDVAGAAAGQVGVAGQSAQSLTLSGTAAAQASVTGTSAGTLATAGTSAGVIGSSPVTGASAALLDVAGAAAGQVGVAGQSARTIDLAAAGAAQIIVSGTSAGTLATTGSAAGVVGNMPATGASAATLQLSGSAVGGVLVAGNSAVDLPVLASGASQILVRGASAGTLAVAADLHSVLDLISGHRRIKAAAYTRIVRAPSPRRPIPFAGTTP